MFTTHKQPIKIKQQAIKIKQGFITHASANLFEKTFQGLTG